MTEYKQTLGEYRVGVSFNPSNNPLVDEIKRKAADLIDLIWSLQPMSEFDSIKEFEDWSEVHRLQAIAAQHVEEAAMWAVKAATKPERQ